MVHELIEDKDILVAEALRHVEGVILYLVVVYWATTNYAVHVPTSSVASVVSDIWVYISTRMVKKDVMLG